MRMQIVLSETDFKKLSAQAQTEILNLQRGNDNGYINGGADSDFGAYDLTPALARQFLNGVSDVTRKFVKVFAENRGRAKPDQMLKATGRSKYTELTGITSGITRRLRKISGVREAYLLDWDYEGEEAGTWDGEWIVTETTYESLKKYFGIDSK